jgi:hypothetical protein
MCDWIHEEMREEEKTSARARANDLKKVKQTNEEKPLTTATL